MLAFENGGEFKKHAHFVKDQSFDYICFYLNG